MQGHSLRHLYTIQHIHEPANVSRLTVFPGRSRTEALPSSIPLLLASSPSPCSAAVNLLAQTFGMHNRRGQANSLFII